MKKPAPADADFYHAATYCPDGSVGLMMRTLVTTLARNIECELTQADLTNAQWVPLYKLYTGSAGTAAELARECQMDAGAMTRLLDRLEAKGLCQRTRSETDRRVVHIALTDSGRKAALNIPHALSKVQNELLSGFNADEFAILKGFLQRMLTNVQVQGSSISPVSPD